MKRPLILSTCESFAKTKSEQFRLIKEAGFDGVFTYGEWDRTGEFARDLRSMDMQYQSVHASYGSVDALWKADEERAKTVLDGLKFALSQCIANEIPLMIVHAYIGFDEHELQPNQRGLDRFGELVKMAENSGVKIAFENTEGLEYLEYLLKAFSGEKHIGFCWDSGHEMCYNYSENLLEKYGNRLFGTHLNDNLGIKDRQNITTWRDDLHLLPFDGIADWDELTKRLAKTGFDGPLTFELLNMSKEGRHDNDKYSAMPIEQYLAEAYARACKVRSLLEKAQNNG